MVWQAIFLPEKQMPDCWLGSCRGVGVSAAGRGRRGLARSRWRARSWVAFCATGEGFVATGFKQDTSDPGRYFTLDFWRSRAAYEALRWGCGERYEAHRPAV